MRDAAFRLNVYKMAHWQDPVKPQEVAAIADGFAGHDVGGRIRPSVTDTGESGGGHVAGPESDDDIVGDADITSPPAPSSLQVAPAVADSAGGAIMNIWATQLLRQWYSSALERYMYFSFPASDDAGPHSLRVYQILEMENRALLVPTFQTDDELAQARGLFTIMVQPMQQFGDLASDLDDGASEVVCFAFEEPCKIDVLTAVGLATKDRWSCRSWSAAGSDIDQCIRLHSPARLRTVGVESPAVPVLTLMEALRRQGWSGRQGVAHHSADSQKVFDSRNPIGKRMYFKCLLSFADLLARGVQGFSSVCPAAYYGLLLRGHTAVRPGMSAKHDKSMLADRAGGDSLQPLVPIDFVSLRAPPWDGAADSDSDVVGDFVARPAPPPLADGSADGGGASAPSGAMAAQGALADEAGSAGDAALALAPVLDDVLPTEIEGMPVYKVSGRQDNRWSYHGRLRVKCRNAEHEGCWKSRSIEMDKDRFGPRAAEFFLGAWQLQSHLPEARHRALKPTVAMVRSYAHSHQ